MRKTIRKILGLVLTVSLLIPANLIYATTKEKSANELPEQIEITEATKGYQAGDTIVSFLGDSVTTYTGYTSYTIFGDEFGNYYNESIMPVEDTWWMGLLMNNQWTLGLNESLGGSCVASQNDEQSLPNMASDMRINKLDRYGTPDKIFIFGGLNDIFSSKIQIGKYSPNLTFGKVDTFADAYYTMIKKIEIRYPEAEIICMIPYETTWATVYPYVKEGQEWVPRVIKGICNQEGILCIDLRNAGIDPQKDVMLEDELHPNAGGMTKIKNYVEQCLATNNSMNVGKRNVAHYTMEDGSFDTKTETFTLKNGEIAKDSFFCDGVDTYYLQYDGTPMKNRLTYHPDGRHIIYFDEQGHEVFNDFIRVKKSIAGETVDDLCFFNTYGYMYVDVITYDKTGSNLYYVNPYGVVEQDGWFAFSDIQGGGAGFANPDGTLLTSQFSYDKQGRLIYFQGDGTLARGIIHDGTTNYEMDEVDGHLIRTF